MNHLVSTSSQGRQIMMYPTCLGHLFYAGGKTFCDGDTFSFHWLQRGPEVGGLWEMTSFKQLKSGGINSSLGCTHSILDLYFTKLNRLSWRKQPLKYFFFFLLFFLSFPSSFSSLVCYVILLWTPRSFLTLLLSRCQTCTLFPQSNILSFSYLGFPFEIVRIVLEYCFRTSEWVSASHDPQILSE